MVLFTAAAAVLSVVTARWLHPKLTAPPTPAGALATRAELELTLERCEPVAGVGWGVACRVRRTSGVATRARLRAELWSGAERLVVGGPTDVTVAAGTGELRTLLPYRARAMTPRCECHVAD